MWSKYTRLLQTNIYESTKIVFRCILAKLHSLTISSTDMADSSPNWDITRSTLSSIF
jgi:hypothetical protein